MDRIRKYLSVIITITLLTGILMPVSIKAKTTSGSEEVVTVDLSKDYDTYSKVRLDDTDYWASAQEELEDDIEYWEEYESTFESDSDVYSYADIEDVNATPIVDNTPDITVPECYSMTSLFVDSHRRSKGEDVIRKIKIFDSKSGGSESDCADILPEVRDQSGWGTCWAHAVLGSVESGMIRAGMADNSVDLSERYLAYAFGYLNSNYNGPVSAQSDYHHIVSDSIFTSYLKGANTVMAANLLSSWKGVALEADAPYVRMSMDEQITKYKSEGSAKGLNFIRSILPTVTPELNSMRVSGYRVYSSNDTDEIKKALLTGGGATISYVPSKSYDYRYYADQGVYRKCQYSTNTSTEGSHAVVIVGWDDNFSADNFSKTYYDGKFHKADVPPHDGAWLIRNSWGESFCDGGYMWMSYYDLSIHGNIVQIETDAYSHAPTDKVFQNDLSCMAKTYTGSKEANVFTVDDRDRKITAVSFATWSSDVNYMVSLYANPDSKNPEKGVSLLSSPVYYYADSAGYHKVDLPQSVVVPKGQKFSVVITALRNVGSPVDVKFGAEGSSASTKRNVVTKIDGINNNFTLARTYNTWADKEESYLFQKDKWFDVGALPTNKANMRIKAYSEESNIPKHTVTINGVYDEYGNTGHPEGSFVSLNGGSFVNWSIIGESGYDYTAELLGYKTVAQAINFRMPYENVNVTSSSADYSGKTITSVEDNSEESDGPSSEGINETVQNSGTGNEGYDEDYEYDLFTLFADPSDPILENDFYGVNISDLSFGSGEDIDRYSFQVLCVGTYDEATGDITYFDEIGSDYILLDNELSDENGQPVLGFYVDEMVRSLGDGSGSLGDNKHYVIMVSWFEELDTSDGPQEDEEFMQWIGGGSGETVEEAPVSHSGQSATIPAKNIAGVFSTLSAGNGYVVNREYTFQNAVQGPLCRAAFALATPKGFIEGPSFNLLKNGNLSYDRKTGIMALVIPENLKKSGRAYGLLAVDRQGKVTVYPNTSKDAGMITTAVDIAGYAFEIIYTP